MLLAALAPFGRAYGLAGNFRAWLFQAGIFSVWRAPVPVISVGNLTVGGTGKTPASDWLAARILERGYKVAVVSRGYGGKYRRGVGVVCRGRGPELDPRVCGDEPYLLAHRNPGAVVLVSTRRKTAIEVAVKTFAVDVIILDDGFQHLAVARDLDILLLDARRPFGNRHPLPAGPLRELPKAVRRADCLLLTRFGENGCATSPDDFPGLEVLTSSHVLAGEAKNLAGERKPLAELRGKKCIAFAGIGDPDSFFHQLAAIGLELAATVALPDHAVYDNATLGLLERLGEGNDCYLTTEKDGVKLSPEVLSRPCYQVLLKLHIHQAGRLEDRVLSLLPAMEKP